MKTFGICILAAALVLAAAILVAPAGAREAEEKKVSRLGDVHANTIETNSITIKSGDGKHVFTVKAYDAALFFEVQNKINGRTLGIMSTADKYQKGPALFIADKAKRDPGYPFAIVLDEDGNPTIQMDSKKHGFRWVDGERLKKIDDLFAKESK
jgi:hypothetical protein